MFSAFLGGFTELTKKPSYFIPSLLGMLASLFVLVLAIESYFNVFYDSLILGETPESSLIEFPFHMFSFYGADLIVIGLATFISIGISFYMIYVYASLLNGQEKSAISAFTKNLKKISEIFWLTFFVFVGLFLYSVIAYALFVASITFEGIGIITFLLFVAWLIIGLIAYLNLIFTPVIMSVEMKKLKPALKASWQWSKKRTIGIAIFIAILGFITGLVGAIFSAIGESVGIEELGVLILLIGLGFTNAYYNIAFIKFYLNHRQ
tara:strand:+ start:470 stop:1261 length:792 start_codon:yes stop_codon:yes gene_type:complete